MARAPGVRSGCLSFSLSFFFDLRGRGGVAGESVGHVEREDRVAALGGAILHDIFPLFLVIVFLLLAPGLARGEVDGLRIGRPGKCVNFFFALGDGEGFAAAGRDQVDLRWLAFRRNRNRNRYRRRSSRCLRSERKAIHLPSGDHLGSESCPDCVS